MSETEQRRDISDAATVEHFADTVGSLKRLQMLTVLTVVDIRAVGPGIWNDWKGELIRQLYLAARKVLMAQNYIPDDEQPKPTPVDDDSQLEALQKRLPKPARNKEHYVKAKLVRAKDITELWVLTRDRKHLFADLAGAIAACGAETVGAKLLTAKDGRVFNRFYLQNNQGLAFGRKNSRRLRDLEKKVLDAATAKSKAMPRADICRHTSGWFPHPASHCFAP